MRGGDGIAYADRPPLDESKQPIDYNPVPVPKKMTMTF
jgi:hypothetical protein